MKATRKNKKGKIEKNKDVMEGDCIFPFKKKSILYNDCMTTEKGDICATEINPKTKTLKKYGYCEEPPKKKIIIIKKKLLKPKIERKFDIDKFKEEGSLYLDTLNEKQLETIIELANQVYYGNEKAILTDDEYDTIRDYTLKKYPENKIALEGHINLKIENVLNKIKLPYEMWSMDKKKPEDIKSIEKWMETFPDPYVISCKLDGISGLYSTEGDIPKLYTRGNGIIGQDVTHLIPYLKLPKDKDIVIRGEFIVSKNNFKKVKGEFSNARNYIGGIVNTKKPKKQHLQNVEFICYEVIKPILKPTEQMIFIDKLKIPCVQYFVEKKINLDILTKVLRDWRTTSAYDMDGIICTSDIILKRIRGNPKHAFAFKMALEDQMMESNVVDVIWTPSKDGYLKPRVKIEEIELVGVKINYATGFNAKFIVDNKIGKESIVQIIRSGDVIPHIYKVIKQSKEPIMPKEAYIWNETKVDIILNESSIEVNEKIITAFFKNIGVVGLGAGNIKKMMDSGNDTIEKILAMKKSDYEGIPGFKEKLIDKIYNGIQEKMEEATLGTIMEATNIFGRGFGSKKIDLILKTYPDILTSSEENKINLLLEIHGMSIKTAERFIDKIPVFMTWLTNSKLLHKLKKIRIYTPTKDSSSELLFNNQKIVFTGFRDKVMSDFIEKMGGTIQPTITKTTNILIVKNKEDMSSKIKLAIQYGTEIIDCKTFKKKYSIF